MSLGLPSHLATRSLHDVRVRAGNLVSLTMLATVVLILLELQSVTPQLVLWPALLASAVFLGQVLLLILAPGALLSISYLIVGAAATYSIALVVDTQIERSSTVTAFILIASQAALVLVGGVGETIVAHLLWATAGWLIAEGVVRLAAVQAGVDPGTLTPILLVYLLMAAVIVVDPLARRRGVRAQPSLHRAVRDQEVAALRDRIELKANALMHDTVLNQLAAIANAPVGPIAPTMRRRIEEDLSLLVGEEWLSDIEPSLDEDAGTDWVQSELFAVIQEARGLGLDIDVAGDLTGISALDPARAKALSMAVGQGLTNVSKHAGVDHAEVVVYGSETDITVMVMDSGVGFSEGATGDDRLGLRNSIRRRIELVGGTVQLWSGEGTGTSIVIQVPLGPLLIDVDTLDETDEEMTS